MNKYRNRAILYLAEVTFGAVLVLLPLRHDLPVLTTVGLFLHVTTSLGALPFNLRLNAIGAGSGTLFGMREHVFFTVVIAAGLALMGAWALTQSMPAYLAGVFVAASGVEALVTRAELE
ncbi:hypothetical protein IP92_05956 [Pseudoduganella flava]|uniref:Uncharacterized protein n=1 Tax=Pseudoduganella flava TaxID=871742 RepID=A0A562P664_9BURK|nr:hypothetical protein [Pseudoduganella flava]QGZ40010.1 hypothetical protein GO485_13730 [Pseudoduganella flava]TWI39942.1 hypothetical protein IP92_05956 [Pseudoduganella flava]